MEIVKCMYSTRINFKIPHAMMYHTITGSKTTKQYHSTYLSKLHVLLAITYIYTVQCFMPDS